MIEFKDAELIETVLEQNEALRARFPGDTSKTAEFYRRLWRCPICFERRCADRAHCRRMLELFARERWDSAIGRSNDQTNYY